MRAQICGRARWVALIAMLREGGKATKTTVCLLLVAVPVLAAGRGSSGSESAGEPSGQSTAASTGSTTPDTTRDAPTLVGRWERLNECPQLVKAFEQAGLAELAPSFVGDYFPDATPQELARKDDLCEGAEPFVHSHFFDDADAFGSLTENLEQVDDGSYEIVDDGTFVISKEFPDVTFHSRIDGDELTLSPVLTRALKEDALAHPLEFSAAGWAITMSYAGHEWKRVDCAGWC
jgi:hypothetical protein